MLRSDIQRELDRAEEYILEKLFGSAENIEISNNLKMIFALKGIDFNKTVNHYIEVFESFMTNFMLENGFLDVEKLEKVISIKFPILQGLKLPTARLIDFIKEIEKIIPAERIGEIIRKI